MINYGMPCIYLLFAMFIGACNSSKCKRIDFDSVFSDSCRFYNSYSYSNNFDTLNLVLKEIYFTKEYNLGVGVFPCNPYFELIFESQDFDLKLICTLP
jgi:hypothetical protein